MQTVQLKRSLQRGTVPRQVHRKRLMATIRKEFTISTPPDRVWAALRDFGRVHQVLAPGFVSGCTVEEGGTVRAVSFANGMSVRERLVGCDDALRRLAYAAEGGRATFHHASAEVI